MHLQLDEYLPYSYSLSDIFGTNINSKFICCNGYTNYSGKKQLITCILNILDMFRSDFMEAQVIIPCSRNIICNSCYQNIVSGDIFNDVGSLDEQEYFGLSGSFFKK